MSAIVFCMAVLLKIFDPRREYVGATHQKALCFQSGNAEGVHHAVPPQFRLNLAIQASMGKLCPAPITGSARLCLRSGQNRLQPEAYRMYSLRARMPLSSNGALWFPRKSQLLLPDDGFSLPEIVSGDSSIMCYYSRWFSICQAPKRPCFRKLKLQMLHRRNISKA